MALFSDVFIGIYLPPGIRSTSTSGGSAKTCVGTISCPNDDDAKVFGSGFVDTGAMDSAMMESSILWSRESTFKVLRGPKTSVVVQGQIYTD